MAACSALFALFALFAGFRGLESLARSPGASDELLHVLGDHVDLEVDLGAWLLHAERGALERLGDEADLEPVVADPGNGKADAVDGDGTFVHDVPAEARGQADADDLPLLLRVATDDGGRAVGVPLDEMAAEPVLKAHRALQVDLGAGSHRLEAGVPQGLPHHVGREAEGGGRRRFLSPVRRTWAGADQRGNGQADAAHADRVSRFRVLRHHAAANVNAGEVAQMLDRLDLAEVLNDTGEQPRPPPVRLRGTRLLAAFDRALRERLSNAAGHGRRRAAARGLPPIRTLTVGPGVPPGQPAAVAAGSRTITAGSEFHRPRSTLTSANQCATRDIPDRTPRGGRPPCTP